MAFAGYIVPLPIGTGGLTGTHSMTQVELDKLLVAQNLTYENGTLQKEGGAVKYNSAAIAGAPIILGGYDWWPSSAVQRMVVFTDAGKLLKDAGSGAFATTLASGLSTTGSGGTVALPLFVEGGQEALANNKKLFIFTGGNQVKVLSGDGATVANLATPPADWASQFPIAGCLHNNRLWGGMGHRVYFSTFTDHENFTDVANAGTLPVYPGVGERIVSMISYKGFLIVAKYPRGIYAIDTTSPTIANWTTRQISVPIGAAGPGAMLSLGDDVSILDPAGVFHLLSAVTDFGDVGLSASSRPAKMDTFLADNCSLNKLRTVQSVLYPTKREAHFAVSRLGVINDSRLVLDLNQTGLIRWRFSDRDINESLWLRKDVNNIPRLMAGSNGGFVYQLDQTSRLKDGAGYTGRFQSPHLDMSHLDPSFSAKRKLGHFLECVVEPKGNWNLLVDILWDGIYHETVAFNMGVSGNSLGSFVIGTDALAADAVLNKKRRITGSGRRISLVGYNSGIGEDFSISEFLLHFTLGDERL